MKQYVYHVSGMHCTNCALTIEDALSKLPGVTRVRASYPRERVEITTKKQIPFQTFQQIVHAIPGHYSLSKTKAAKTNSPLWFQTYKPIVFVYLAILGFVFVRAQTGSAVPMALMADFMGAFFVIFSLFKLLNLKNFPRAYKQYDYLAKWIPGYAWIYPFVEFALGIAFLTRFNLEDINIITLVLMVEGTVSVIIALRSKKVIECACLGGFFKLPMSRVALFEDLSMVLMSFVMLVAKDM